MARILLLNAAEAEERRVALVQDGRLEAYRAERAGSAAPQRGNVYKGKVVNLETGIGAAFVALGSGRNGFLHMSDCLPRDGKAPARIEEHVALGDPVLVQVSRESVGSKGPMLTQNIGLPGRFLVLLPFSEGGGISRRITERSEREKLRELLEHVQAPAEVGWILRTAASGCTRKELQRDLSSLLRVWRAIDKRSRTAKAPALLHAEGDVLVRSLRDLVDKNVDEIRVDDAEEYQQVQESLRALQPRLLDRLRLYEDARPLFHAYEIEDQVDRLASRRLSLPSGGSLVIDRTEALVAIDVNSGRTREEEGLEETARRTNLDAAPEIASQLRLRDLGGVVVIDFIDMLDKNHVREVERTLKQALKADRAKVRMGRIGPFGTLALTRQRIVAQATGETRTCPACGGAGEVQDPLHVALRAFRELKERCGGKGRRGLRVILRPEAARLLRERRKEALEQLCRSSGRKLLVEEDPDLAGGAWRLEHVRSA